MVNLPRRSPLLKAALFVRSLFDCGSDMAYRRAARRACGRRNYTCWICLRSPLNAPLPQQYRTYETPQDASQAATDETARQPQDGTSQAREEGLRVPAAGQ